MRTIIIQKGDFFDKFAYLEDGKLKELKFINKKQNYFEKDIFLAKKKKENISMKSLELALDKNTSGFMHYRENSPEQYVLCQIKKIYNNDKNPKLTDEISLSGKYAVVLKANAGVFLSGKLTDTTILKDFEEKIDKEILNNKKIIIRSNYKKENFVEALKEIKVLSDKLDEIEKKSAIISKPQIIYRQYTQEEMFLSKINEDIDILITNDKNTQKIFENSKFNIKDIKLEINSNLFDLYNINFEISKLLESKVKLENNINLFIEKTEAMNIIDVNSAGYFKYKDKSKNAFYINNYVLDEIVNQIILRDLTGIILIDFIDMNNDKLSKKLLENMNKILKQDKRKSKAVSVTSLTLMQIVRKKEDLNMREQLLSSENINIKSPDFISEELEYKLKNLGDGVKSADVYLPCFFSDEMQQNIKQIEENLDIKLNINYLKREDFNVKIKNPE